MEMKFRSPAPTATGYVLEGRLIERRGRRLLLEASCRAEDRVVAEASALFLATEAVAW